MPISLTTNQSNCIGSQNDAHITTNQSESSSHTQITSTNGGSKYSLKKKTTPRGGAASSASFDQPNQHDRRGHGPSSSIPLPLPPPPSPTPNPHPLPRSRVSWLEGDGRGVPPPAGPPSAAPAAPRAAPLVGLLLDAGLHSEGHGLCRVGGLLGGLAHLVLVLVLVVVAVLVVEGLQREAAVGLLAAPAALGYVRVVLAHRLRLVDLQLGVQPLQLRLQNKTASGPRGHVQTSQFMTHR